MKNRNRSPLAFKFYSTPQSRRENLLLYIEYAAFVILLSVMIFMSLTRNPDFINYYRVPTFGLALSLVTINRLTRNGQAEISKHLMLLMLLLGIWAPLYLYPQILSRNLTPMLFSTIIVLYGSLFYASSTTTFFAVMQVVLGGVLIWKTPALQTGDWGTHLIFYLIFSLLAIISGNLNRRDLQQIDHQTYELGISNKELIYKEKELYQLAFYDSLTKLGTPHKFREDCNRLTESASLFTLVDLDIDRFGFINETLGHQLGDQLLMQFAHILSQVIKSDTIYRWSEDEFLIILHTHNRQNVVRLIQRIQTAMGRCSHSHNFHVQCTVSAGIALHPLDGSNQERLLQSANLALDQAKRMGRNRIHFYTKSLQRQIDKTYAIQKLIDHGLRTDAFELYFQPIYRLEDHSIHSAEVLLRAPMTDFTLQEIISVAEMTLQIVEIDKWVLKNIFEMLVHEKNMFRNLTLSINLSSQTFRSEELLDYLKYLKNQSAIVPRQIELEITEYSLIEDFDISLKTLTALKKMGFRMAIDDFGTKYSSLNYLSKLPLDVLKIDKSYIDQINTRSEDRTIVKHLILLAQELNLVTIAEGIEQQVQCDLLENLGCELGQGYLFAHPMPLESLRVLLLQPRPVTSLHFERMNKKRGS